jgi:hypothetical protein
LCDPPHGEKKTTLPSPAGAALAAAEPLAAGVGRLTFARRPEPVGPASDLPAPAAVCATGASCPEHERSALHAMIAAAPAMKTYVVPLRTEVS